MRFHTHINDIGEPRLIVDVDTMEAHMLSVALFDSVSKHADWIVEISGERDFLKQRLMVLAEKAELHGAMSAASELMWELHQQWEALECEDCASLDDDGTSDEDVSA